MGPPKIDRLRYRTIDYPFDVNAYLVFGAVFVFVVLRSRLPVVLVVLTLRPGRSTVYGRRRRRRHRRFFSDNCHRCRGVLRHVCPSVDAVTIIFYFFFFYRIFNRLTNGRIRFVDWRATNYVRRRCTYPYRWARSFFNGRLLYDFINENLGRHFGDGAYY